MKVVPKANWWHLLPPQPASTCPFSPHPFLLLRNRVTDRTEQGSQEKHSPISAHLSFLFCPNISKEQKSEEEEIGKLASRGNREIVMATMMIPIPDEEESCPHSQLPSIRQPVLVSCDFTFCWPQASHIKHVTKMSPSPFTMPSQLQQKMETVTAVKGEQGMVLRKFQRVGKWHWGNYQ